MNTNFEKQYLEQCRSLVMSLRIKFSAFADILNSEIIAKHGDNSVIKEDKSTWAYYMHLAGEYHPLYDSTVMEVISLDTQEVIDFTKENLEIHLATKNAYRYGTRYYYSLIQRYPDKEELILGILYPCDKQKAIEAREFQILGYDSEYVEQQEYKLIDSIQYFIDGHAFRWYVHAFNLTNPYYVLAYYTCLYLAILQKIFAIRLDASKTPFAHSFYIREYLKSNSKLDVYIPYMTTKQLMFIYRNLKRLQLHVGKVERFDLLLQKLLTDRFIPLSEFSIRQLSSFNNDWYPDLTIRSKALNPEINEKLNNYYTLEQVFGIEQKTLPTNAIYHEAQAGVIEKKIQNNSSSVVQSKALFSAMADYNSDDEFTLDKILLRQWIHLTSLEYVSSSSRVKNFYSAYVNFKLPGVSDLKTLSSKDALIYFMFLVNDSLGMGLVDKCEVYVAKQRKLRKPTYQYLTGYTTANRNPILKEYTLDSLNGHPEYPLSSPGVYGINSVNKFYEIGVKLFNEMKRQGTVTGLMDSVLKKGMLQHIYDRFFEGKLYEIKVPDSMDFKSWMKLNSLPYEFSLEADRTKLISDIFQAATGFFIDETKLLKNIQSAMISMMQHLTSYSIAYHREINDESLVTVKLDKAGVDITRFSRKLDLEVGTVYDLIGVKYLRTKDYKVYNLDGDFLPTIQLANKSTVFNIAFDDIENVVGRYNTVYEIIGDDLILKSVDYIRTDRITSEVEVYDAQTYYDRLAPAVQQSLLTKFMSK